MTALKDHYETPVYQAGLKAFDELKVYTREAANSAFYVLNRFEFLTQHALAHHNNQNNFAKAVVSVASYRRLYEVLSSLTEAVTLVQLVKLYEVVDRTRNAIRSIHEALRSYWGC